jgi:lipoate-protein ligase A
MLFLENRSTDPAYNLALEEHLVINDDRAWLMLWSNDPVVVVGRNQHTENQVDRRFAEKNGIQVVRRLSGGGAVYHDLGNLNFTFVVRDALARRNDFAAFAQPVIDVLRSYGVDATFSGRNDMIVAGKKFSGNAQYNHGATVLHHGTILWDSDLSVLNRVLKPKQRVEARGVDSHESRVANLIDHVPAHLTRARFERDLVERLTSEATDLLPDVPDALIAKYRSEVWNWGAGMPETDDSDIRSYPASC